MNAKEFRLAAQMLELASDEFSNHGCNDWDWPDDWTLQERQSFMREFHEWNGDPEEFDPDWLVIGDSSVMSFLAEKLKTAAA